MNDSERRAALDKLGEQVVVAARDKTLDEFTIIVQGRRRGVLGEQLQKQYDSLSDQAKSTLVTLVFEVVNDCIHNLLFAIQDAHDRDLGVDVVVDGISACQASDGLHGEPFTENGWISAFGRYPEMPDSGSTETDS